MSRKENEGVSQSNEPICPPMTLSQQVKGTIYLIRLALEVARLVIELIKLIKPYQSVKDRPTAEIADGLGENSAEMERSFA